MQHLTAKKPEPNLGKEFAAGLHKACAFYDIELIGGDTTRSPGPIFINITMGGVADCPVVTRSGARAGDHLWVSGCPGLAAAGYYFDDPFPDALAALRHPTPPLHFARALAHRNCISAMMDLSDGLSADLPRLCHASGVGARVERDRLPHHPELSNVDSTYALRLSGGDDFQLLFTAAPEQKGRHFNARCGPQRYRDADWPHNQEYQGVRGHRRMAATTMDTFCSKRPSIMIVASGTSVFSFEQLSVLQLCFFCMILLCISFVFSGTETAFSAFKNWTNKGCLQPEAQGAVSSIF